MPCLSSNAVSALNESIRVSNAASQLAVPFITKTFLGSSVNSSPKGSAFWTLAVGGGGLGVAAGLVAGEAEGAGDCASAAPQSATMASAATAARKVLIRFISGILHPPHLATAGPGSAP